MNHVILIGNLTKDPELRTTQSGISNCTMTLAVNRRRNKGGVQEADFIAVVAWRQLAELCSRYLSKGRKCAVSGSIQTRSYDAQDGSKRYVTEVIADNVEFLDSRQEGAHTGAQPPRQPQGEFTEVDDDELPF